MAEEYSKDQRASQLSNELANNERKRAPIPCADESSSLAARLIGYGIVIPCILYLVLLLIPAMPAARENARRAYCLNNLKQIGLGFVNYEQANKRFPGSCHVKRDEQDHIVSMDGYSWIVDLLPYMENRALYDTLDMSEGLPLAHLDDLDHPTTLALGTVVPEIHCPTFDGTTHIDTTTELEAITNYKVIGATHLESLSVASPKPMTPKYLADKEGVHPDGAIYPGSTHGVEAFQNDGTSRTAIVVESVEQNVARWTVGAETCVVALPPVVTFPETPQYRYYHPTGYEPNAFFDQSAIPPEINKTYLNWDFGTTAYLDGGVSTQAKTAIKYGPSSHHSGVTNHLYADGSVHAISNAIDAAAYFFLTTRDNNDPAPQLE